MLPRSNHFDVKGPDSIAFGRGTVSEVGERAAEHGDSVLVVTDSGIRDAGLLDDVLGSIEGEGLTVEVFDSVTPDPDAAVVRECRNTLQELSADVVIGVGGGSPMDVAKAAALLVRTERPIGALYGRGKDNPEGLPTILVPTTSGTGSEVSSAIVLYDDHGDKQAIIGDAVFADAAVIDPNLTMHLPPELTRATGLDAFAHAMGSYISMTTNTFADTLTVKAMELIQGNLREATFHGAEAPNAREKLSLAATMAMWGRVNGGKAVIHSVAYGLQEMYDLPHGEAIAMVLPEVVEYNLPAAVEELAELGTRIYDAEGAARERAQAVVDGLYQLRADVGLDRSLQSVGARKEDLDRLAELAVHSERHLEANPRDMTQEDARDLLEGMW